MKITIFGLPGTGTSTAGKLLASRLDYPFSSGGNMFRQVAASQNLTINELDNLSRTTDVYDIELDRVVEEYGKNNANLVFEGLLGWKFIPDSVKVKFTCEHDIRIKRIMEREGKSREQVETESLDCLVATTDRYTKYYSIPEYPPKDARFDLVIDTTSILPEEVVQQIEKFILTKESA